MSVKAKLATLQQLAADASTSDQNGPVARARNAGTVISVVVIGVVALVGILIFAEVNSQITQDHVLNDTADEIVTGFGDAMGLVPIILIVLLASIVIAVVQRMRQ